MKNPTNTTKAQASNPPQLDKNLHPIGSGMQMGSVTGVPSYQFAIKQRLQVKNIVASHVYAKTLSVSGSTSIANGTLTNYAVNSGTVNNSQISGATITTSIFQGGTINGLTTEGGTISNGVFGTPTIKVGSDNTGDLYYNNGGTFTRLGIGANTQVLTTNGTIPSWGNTSAAIPWNTMLGTLSYGTTDGHTSYVNTSVDNTGQIGLGMKLTLANNGTQQYYIVTGTAAGSLTLYGGTAYAISSGGTLTLGSYSGWKAPYGFPTRPDYWTDSVSDSTGGNQAPTVGTWYNTGSNSLAIPIGAWRVFYMCDIGVNGNAGQRIASTLSTANNTQSDSDFTAVVKSPATNIISSTIFREKYLVLASKTTYYLNIESDQTAGTIYLDSSNSTTFIKATSAYL